jgi:uncharacterized protein
VTCLGAIVPSALCATPSFLCSKAKTWVEHVICDNDSLAVQDLQLASDYARLLDKLAGDAAKRLAAEQRAWWATRSECRDAGDPLDCLWKKYDERITALRVRPDFPADNSAPRTEVLETNIKDSAAGWSKHLAQYVRAIRACLPIAPVEIAAVSNAWLEPEDQQVAVRLLASNEESWVCIAHRDGSSVIDMREKSAEEKLPEPGPYLYLAPPPKAQCGAVQVIDANDQLVGWLSNRLCE